MEAQEQEKQKYKRRKRRVISIVVVFSIVVLAVLWIMSSLAIIPQGWATIPSIILAVLGVLFAFLQLLSKGSSETSVTSRLEVSTTPVNLNTDKPEPQNYSVLVEGIDLGITKRKGAIVVYANKNLRGKTVDLYAGFPGFEKDVKLHSTDNIVERTVSGQPVFTAVFQSLEPGNYTVTTGIKYYNRLTVYAGKASEVDWR